MILGSTAGPCGVYGIIEGARFCMEQSLAASRLQAWTMP